MSQTDDDWDVKLEETPSKDPTAVTGGLGSIASMAGVTSIEGRPSGTKGSRGSAGGYEYPSTRKKTKGLKPQFEGLVRGRASSCQVSEAEVLRACCLTQTRGIRYT
jgi:hypothetical protein